MDAIHALFELTCVDGDNKRKYGMRRDDGGYYFIMPDGMLGFHLNSNGCEKPALSTINDLLAFDYWEVFEIETVVQCCMEDAIKALNEGKQVKHCKWSRYYDRGSIGIIDSATFCLRDILSKEKVWCIKD
jgi:hypothetical protein